jgi:hypothetical protein
VTEPDKLLTDEFVRFSDAIKALYEEKKTLKEGFKKVYEEFQNKIKDVDARASKLAEEFNKGQVVKEPVPEIPEKKPSTEVINDDPDGAYATVTSQSKKNTGKK